MASQHLFEKNEKEGFTLIESILAIGVLVVGILGAFILVVRSLSNIPLIQSRLIAANLAQEGIELIRQKRDSNWLQGQDWRAGLGDCECQSGSPVEITNCLFEIDSKTRQLSKFDRHDYLNFDEESGLYSYGGGEGAPFYFKRKIEICYPVENNYKEMRVKVTVDWQVKKSNFSIIVEDHLYNYFTNSVFY